MTQQSEGADSQAQTAEQATTIAPAAFASAAKAFSKAQAEFERNRAKMQAALDGVKVAIGELEREKIDILRYPASRAEFVEALCADVDRRAANAVQNIQWIVDSDNERIARNEKTKRHYARTALSPDQWTQNLQPSAHAGSLTYSDLEWHRIRAIRDGEDGAAVRGWLFNAIVSCERDEKAALSHPKFNGDMMALFFGEALKAGLRRAFEQIEWQYPDAAPSAERMVRLEAIEAELTGLRAQEAELLDVLGGASIEGA